MQLSGLYCIIDVNTRKGAAEIRAAVAEQRKMYHIIVNSTRVKGEDDANIAVVRSVLDRAGKQYEFHFTRHPGHASELAAQLTAGEESVRLIAMGGDGTLHEVLNGVRDTSRCKLGVIPVGSGNDFAAAMDIPEDNIKYAAQLIAFRSPTYIDYIQLSTGLRSLNAVGCGMDVDVLKRTYASNRKGKSKYLFGFLKSFLSYRARRFAVEIDGGERKNYNGLIACLGNGKQIGGGIRLFPKAKPDDGYMDFIIVDYLSRFKTFVAFAKLFFGKLDSIREVTSARCRQAVIYPCSDSFTIQAEGELYDYSNCDSVAAEIVAGKLRFYLPHSD